LQDRFMPSSPDGNRCNGARRYKLIGTRFRMLFACALLSGFAFTGAYAEEKKADGGKG
jgi:hypothetical protein